MGFFYFGGQPVNDQSDGWEFCSLIYESFYWPKARTNTLYIVHYENKYTKCSSNTLLRLVYLFFVTDIYRWGLRQAIRQLDILI